MIGWSARVGPEREWIYGTEKDFDDFWDWIGEFMEECRAADYPREIFSNQQSNDLELNPPKKYINNVLTWDSSND